MKQTVLLTLVLAAIFTVSCVHETKNMKEVASDFEKCIEYHDKSYMKAREMCVPHNVDEDNCKPLNYLFAFKQDDTEINGGINRQRYSMNWLTPVEWTSFRLLFESALTRTMRFGRKPPASVDATGRKVGAIESLADSTPQPEGVLLFTTMLNSITAVSDISVLLGGGKLHQTSYSMTVTCAPLSPANTEKKSKIMPFSTQTTGTVYQKHDKYGRAESGILFSDDSIEALHLAQGAVAIVKTINHLYSDYPIVGPVTGYDPNKSVVVIRAAGDTGVLPEMEFVIYARKKADGEEALRVPLFNATLNELGATGTSTLKIWRENTYNKTAREIIKSFYNDFNAAQQEYDFFGCCDGLAEWPTLIIDRPFADED